MPIAVKTPKKLIEVALPLDAINDACAHEKMPGIGAHPRGLHLWWARRPLAAARAVIFSQLVNDPSWQWDLHHPGEIPPSHLKASWANSRKRLFSLIEELVDWDNSTNRPVLEKAKAEILKSWVETCEINKDHPDAAALFDPEVLPGLHDPFSGGGAIPLEAQRLGLDAIASDLNPVAVLINKAMIEIPPTFSGKAPINPASRTERSLAPRQWTGAQGLAEDVRYYGDWMRRETENKIGHLFPQVEVTAEIASRRPDLQPLVGQKLTVLAWLWARTVRSPNPAYRDATVPLVSSFIVSAKAGHETYASPRVDGKSVRFDVRVGKAPPSAKDGTKASGRGANFRCLVSGSPIDAEYIRSEGQAGRIGTQLLAVVAQGVRGRIYLSPTDEMEAVAAKAQPAWKPESEFFQDALGFRIGNYGLSKWSDLFTPRQLAALTTLSDLLDGVRAKATRDGIAAGLNDELAGLGDGGAGAKAYAEAISVYLAFAIDRLADYNSTIATWKPSGEQVMQTYKRQALPMTWDFPESNILADSAICWKNCVKYAADNLISSHTNTTKRGCAVQADAQTQSLSLNNFVSTDPPYYDNIGYADLSDFFYVWLRPGLRSVFPTLFSTVSVPKSEELVATPARHGGRSAAELFFLKGMTAAIGRIAEKSHPAAPITIYYAFKQSETEGESGTTSTGWETFLEAVLLAGLSITGTWPMRTELSNRIRGADSNALASSIVLVCRPKHADALSVSRRSFIRELNSALPEALDEMTRGSGDASSPVAPVDLSQAIIGPGMAIFSKYSAVLEADGSPMTVKAALRLINRFLAEDDFDADTQFCLHWFEQHGWDDGAFGEADQLARAKGTAVNGVVQAGVVDARGGKVRLLRPADYQPDWSPEDDNRLPVWEVLHQLIRVFRSSGYVGAATVIAAVSSKADSARQLAYRLYTLCERAGWTDDARAYNEIITSWAAIEDAAARAPKPRQANLFDA